MRYLITAVFMLLGLANAAAQQFPLTLPADSVYGRLGIGSGPGQAIPFVTLNSRLGNTTTVSCTGTSDDTDTVTRAIASTPSGGTLILSATKCRVAGSGSAIFILTRPITIKSQGSSPGGSGGGFEIATGVPSSRDLFHITGVTNSTLRGWSFLDFNITPQSGCVGKHAIEFDTTAGSTTGFAEILIERLYIAACASAGGNSIKLNNGSSVNANGGPFNVTIRNNWLGGGIDCQKCGDSIRSENNIITGDNAGIVLDQVSGAGGFVSSGDNITALGVCIIIKGAINTTVMPSTLCEAIANSTVTEANLALVDVQGPTEGGSIGGQIQAGTGTNVTRLLRVDNAVNLTIDKVRFGKQVGITAILATSNATSPCITASNYYNGSGTNLSDSSITPGCVWQQFQNFKNGIFVEGAAVTIDASHTVCWGTATSCDKYIYGEATYGGVAGSAFRIFNGGNIALNFGGDTASFPSWSQSGTTLRAKLADGSADAPVTSSTFTASSYVSVGTKIRAAGTAPALTSCGTSPAITGSDLAGEITMGTGGPTGCVVTFNAAYSSAPYCTVSWQATPLASQSYVVSTTAITLTQIATSSNKVNYTCVARSGG